jgi:hypothetical protein
MNWRRGLSYIILKDGFKADGCPICNLLVSGMYKNLFWLLYENVNSVHVRKQLIESNGYCHKHAWLLYQLERKEWNDSLDVAIIYQDLIKKATEALEKIDLHERETSIFSFVRKWKKHSNSITDQEPVTSESSCPACIHQQQIEDNSISSLIEALATPEFQDLYQESNGLCLDHFWKAMNAAQDEEVKAFLLDIQRAKMHKLLELLAEYIYKHDYRFTNEPKGEEVNSPRWAVEMLVGKPVK